MKIDPDNCKDNQLTKIHSNHHNITNQIESDNNTSKCKINTITITKQYSQIITKAILAYNLMIV